MFIKKRNFYDFIRKLNSLTFDFRIRKELASNYELYVTLENLVIHVSRF